MKELYEKPDVEFVSFMLVDNITDDGTNIGDGPGSFQEGVEEW